jgi:glycosyltransferase involved in cell wall biosynthesis
MIGECIDCLSWCDQIIVIDDGSVDDTVAIADSRGAKIINFKHSSFAKRRDEALKHTDTDWVFYIDCDERVTPTLAKEIMVVTETEQGSALRINRTNIYYGEKLSFGGWGDDYVTRIFKKSALQGWHGDVHESPKFSGKEVTLKTTLIHLTHRDTISGLYKTAAWTPLEANALFDAGINKVTFWTVLRKSLMEFLRRAILKKGYKEGMVGFVESTIQAINKALIYIQVWEKQQKPPISQKYQNIENEIRELWQQK